MRLFARDDDGYRPVGRSGPADGRLPSLRTLVRIVVVLVLGGGLGTAAYFLSDLDSRAVIALLDVGDPGRSPQLSFDVPGLKGAAKVAEGLLTPPTPGGDESAPPPAAAVAAIPAAPVALPPPVAAPAPPPAAAASAALSLTPPPSAAPAPLATASPVA
ncbi:MAG: hypothetical protein HY985_05940, partial [Magnetospirillum sp.]|nr:hypothetical protein [Magnetospirillum sp.]